MLLPRTFRKTTSFLFGKHELVQPRELVSTVKKRTLNAIRSSQRVRYRLRSPEAFLVFMLNIFVETHGNLVAENANFTPDGVTQCSSRRYIVAMTRAGVQHPLY